jgi:hypothetical protein
LVPFLLLFFSYFDLTCSQIFKSNRWKKQTNNMYELMKGTNSGVKCMKRRFTRWRSTKLNSDYIWTQYIVNYFNQQMKTALLGYLFLKSEKSNQKWSQNKTYLWIPFVLRAWFCLVVNISCGVSVLTE